MPKHEEDDVIEKKPYSGTSPKKAVWTRELKIKVILHVLKSCDTDWNLIASDMGQPKSKIYDMYRKVLLPNIESGQALNEIRGGSSTGYWTPETRRELILRVVERGKPNWESVCSAVCPDRSRAQLYDMWRKVIWPKVKRGEAL